MKNLLVIVVVAGLAYYGYVTWVQHQKTEEMAVAPASQAAVAPGSPATPPAEPVAAATPAKHIAPDGVYFLLERVSITTDSGVIAAIPGSKLKLEKDNGATLTVTDGVNHFDVNPAQVTNDLDVAGKFSKAQSAQDAALLAWTQQQKIAGAAQAQQRIQQLDAAASAQNKSSALRALQDQYNACVQQEANLRSTLANDAETSHSHYKIHNATMSFAEKSAVYQQINQLENKKFEIQRQIALLQ